MTTFDDRLRRELHDVEPPADPSGVVDRVLRKAARRHARRSAGIVVLTIGVIAGSVGGFYALTRVFVGDRATLPLGSVANGPITYVKHVPSEDPSTPVGSEIHSVSSDGSSRAVLGTFSVNASDLDWSPDGRFLAFGRHELYVLDAVEATVKRVPIRGGAYGVSWSPDGSRIVVSVDVSDGDAIYTMRPDGSDTVLLTRAQDLGWTDWSPDGSQILFVGPGPKGAYQGWDIYVMNSDGSEVTNLTNTEAVDLDPSWSPDGSTILFRSRRDPPPGWTTGDAPDELYLMASDGTNVRRLTHDEAVDQSPVWSPDGTRIAFTSLTQDDTAVITTMRPDGTDRFVIPGISASVIAWQPVPSDEGVFPTSSPPPTPSIEHTPAPLPNESPAEETDIGLGFPVCFAERLGGVDFLGDGVDGNAWTGVPVRDDGTCPRYALPDKHILAVDHTGDGVADSWIDFPFECWNWCPPYAATDLDGNGADELIVVNSFSIMDFHFFAMGPDSKGNLAVEPILVAEPGHKPAGIIAGEPLRIDAWGDAGYGSTIECEGYPEDPVIVWSWSYAPVESNQPTEVHVTRLHLRADGLFHVVGTDDFAVAAGESTGLAFQGDIGRECGVGWGR